MLSAATAGRTVETELLRQHHFPKMFLLKIHSVKSYMSANITLFQVEDTEKLDTLSEGCSSVAARPYLCTGYDIYLVWEPCIM